MRRYLIIVFVLLATSGLPSVLATPECEDSIAQAVTSQCEHLDRVQSIEDFLQFYANLEHLNERCLKFKSPLKTPSETSLKAEGACEASQVVFYQIRQLARLAKRWIDANERVCTLELAMQIYHLHNRIRALRADTLAPRMLRLLANSIAWKCRFTLVARLSDVEKRAPDSFKFIKLVNGMITAGKGSLDNLKPLERVEQFAPILERELSERTLGLEGSNSLGRDGFELKSTNTLRMSFDALKMSCKTLKPYHVNILGSMGLLASLGYADPATTGEPQQQPLKPAESHGDRLLIERWLLSALLCQNLRNVLKMQSVSSEDKSLSRFKILDTQEPDVSVDDETDKTFADYRLPENIPVDILSLTSSRKMSDLFSKYEFGSSSEIVMRKLHLLSGPNYALANSIGTYLDVSRQTNRLGAAAQMTGLKLEMDGLGSADDEEDEEEE